MAPQIALPAVIPAVAAMPGDVRQALPALTVMLVNGAVNFLIATLILIAGWLLSRAVARWMQNLLAHSQHIDETLKPLLINFVRYGILAITLVAVLSQFGVQTTSLIALLGATGLAIGLALQGTLSNVASGVMLLFLRPFRVMERIVVAGAAGTVREIGLFRTEMVTDDGRFVSVPNSSIFSGIIVNTSREMTRRTDIAVDIDRDTDIGAAQRLILDSVTRDPRVLKTPAPRVMVDTLSGPQVLLVVQAWVANQTFATTQSDLRLMVREALTRAGFGPPVPLPAPAVAPWTPPAEPSAQQAEKPN